MIDFLLRSSLRHRLVVMAAAVMLVAVGLMRLREMPVDVFPDLSAPRVTVVTEATGLAPLEVEQLVTYPLEAALNGTEGTRRIRSASAAGISIIWVEFDWSTNDAVARQRVTERLQGANALPPEAEPPLLAPSSSVMGEIAFIALTSESVDPMELRRIAERDVRRGLLAIEGVAQVVPIGGEERQYQVIVDPERLVRYGLTALDVAEAIEHGSQNAPGGYLVVTGQETVVRVLGRAENEEQIASIFIRRRGGVPIRVRDVAEVRVGPSFRRGTASHDGQPAVVMSIVRQPGADTLVTTARVDDALDSMQVDLERSGIEVHRNLFRQADFIETAVDNLFDVLRDGAILVAVILALFLWRPGATVVSVLAIPLSLLSATLTLEALGLRLDTMTLGGLAIAIGELVDDAIIDVENVARRLRERARRPEAERLPVLETVLRGSREIRTSIVSATAILMLVFTPLLALEGLEGRLLRPLAISYLVAIFSSLLVAVTVTPVLCSWLLPTRSTKAPKEPPVARVLLRAYRPVLDWSMRRPGYLLGFSATIVAVALAVLLSTGRSFLPAFNEGSINLAMVVLPGTSIDQSDALGRLADGALLADPAVTSVARRTGRAERDEHVQGSEASELEIQLDADDPRSREELLEDLRERLAIVPGAQFTFGQPISHRIDHMISGHRAALTVRVVGEDLRELRRTAERVRRAMAGVEGLVDVAVEPMIETPELVVDIDSDAAGRHELSRGVAAAAAGLALWGRVVGQVYEDGTSTEVIVRYDAEVARDPERVRAVRVPTPSGASVPLEAIADIRSEQSPNYIMRDDVRRRVIVSANFSGRDSRSAVLAVQDAVREQADVPSGVRIEYAGQFEREEAATARLLVLGLLVIAGILLIVIVTLRSSRRAAIVLVNLPLALAGGVVGVQLAGVSSIATTIGFIALFGIATRNGILIATRMRDLELEGVPREEAARLSAHERLMPILMTAVTAALGLLPLCLALGDPGSEIQAPMALVIVTGLVSATLLNMLLVPALLGRWGGVEAAETSHDRWSVPPGE